MIMKLEFKLVLFLFLLHIQSLHVVPESTHLLAGQLQTGFMKRVLRLEAFEFLSNKYTQVLLVCLFAFCSKPYMFFINPCSHHDNLI